MSANLSVPGYWMVRTSRGSGIVHVTKASTLQGSNSAAYFLGTTRQEIVRNFDKAVGRLGTLLLYEQPGGVSGIADNAVKHGAAIYTPSTAGIQEDWTPVYGLAAILAIGGLIAAPILGAGAVVGTEAGAAGAAGGAAATTGEGAAAAGAGGAAGGGAAAAAKSVAGKVAGSSIGKVAGAVAIGSLFTNPSMWKGIGLVIAGAILIILALTQLTGVSLPVR